MLMLTENVSPTLTVVVAGSIERIVFADAVAVDAAGAAYVTGTTSDALMGADFPTTSGAFQTMPGTISREAMPM